MRRTHPLFHWPVIVIAFILAVSFIFFRNREFIHESDTLTTELVQNAVKKPPPKTRLTIDYGNGKKRAFEGTAVAGMNIHDVFRGIDASVGVAFIVTPDGNLFSIDGIPERADKQWVLSINDEWPAENPLLLSTEIYPGDMIVVQYE